MSSGGYVNVTVSRWSRGRSRPHFVGSPGRVLRAVPALVTELQEARAELGRLRQSHQRVLPALPSLAEDSEQAS
jgi:hypothetical protein